ncbi:ATP-binding cassette domain-containing protein [Oceanicella sp. SM1341]|uniref:ATP-binding cassette domain-containing protein n=1 Tax=Oceanicella sp. SM1341 TaxID=1548889 RepID=UPI000E4B05FD|nr:ATP-binding cassette domain-containing protein [Oceanicella sp. SM1341]
MDPILSVRAATKAYGALTALRGADLTVARGEVHAVCGDNGAGKSTLIKLISGVETPTSGEITVKGRPVSFATPHDALEAGIATIHQDLGLAPRMTIAENIFMGSELVTRRLGLPLLDHRRMKEMAKGYLGRLNSRLTDMDQPVERLSGGQRQAVAISRALRWDAEIIIMDEPTAALGVRETAQVLELIGSLRAVGVTVILISHDMNDVVRIADTVTILSGGRTARVLRAGDTDAQGLANLIMHAGSLAEPA